MRYIQQGMIAALRKKGISAGPLLEVMAGVPRHLFVSEALRYRAYDDASLPIGYGQTISKPAVIAAMVQALELTGRERVLEIGTGSGYQSAVIAQLARSLVTMERIEELFNRARALLFRMNYTNIQYIHSADFHSAKGEFDAVIVAAGADILPPALFGKVADGGRLVIPVGCSSGHRIRKFVRAGESLIACDDIGDATFVPYIATGTA